MVNSKIVLFLIMFVCSMILTGCNYYVNASTGSDANPGTKEAPFKTITKALDVASNSGGYIYVSPGKYNASNGEVFPLKIYDSIVLTGDIAGKGMGTSPTIISGGARYASNANGGSNSSAAVVFPPGAISMIQGFSIIDSSAPIIVDGAKRVTIFANTMKTDLAIWTVLILNKSDATLTSNNISSGYAGVVIMDASTSADLGGNYITTSGPGLHGTGAVHIINNAGPVTLHNNTILGGAENVGLFAYGAGKVDASNNNWKPNVQGADGAGHYSARFVSNKPFLEGNNYATGAGGIQF